MKRKDFVKTSCQLCLLGAVSMLLPGLASCGGSKSVVYKADITNNSIQVPLSMFDANPVQIIRPKGWFYDIAVERHPDQSFTAILMKCTHMDNQLVTAGDGFQCNLHGSHFDKDGNVKKGPAELPLKKYKTSKDQLNLIITI